jgi:L-threonylcarbamoyladenylate synthase
LLRPGLVGLAELEAVVGKVEIPAAKVEGSSLPSPGMLARHYAPRTPLECAADGGAARVAELCREGRRVGWLTQGPAPDVPPGASVRVLPADPGAYAAGLYAVLHDLDAAGLDRIIVALPPDTVEWQAVHDRLRRASE